MKIVIIGGQAAGLTTAVRLKRNIPESDITIIEKNSYVSFGACGLPYFISNEFDDISYMFARTPKDIEQSGIKLLLEHMVQYVDYKNKLIHVNTLTKSNEHISTIKINYDKLIITTGALPNKLPILDLKSNLITSLVNIEQAQYIKNQIKLNNIKSICILGAGYIGLELLEAFTKYNITINLIDIKSDITDNLLDKEFSPIILNALEAYKNINLYLNTDIKEIDILSNKINLKLNNDKKLTIDLLITALGFKPNTELFNNIPFNKLENGAIIINSNGETNIKDIYACGDCASIFHKIIKKDMYIPLATLANKIGRKIADTISKKENSFNGTLGSSCVKILDLEVAKTGITEYEAQKFNIAYKTSFMQDYNHTNYYSQQEKVYIKLLSSLDDKIIGAQIVGKKDAMLRIHALSVAIEAGITSHQLANLDFAYSPPFTRTWEALNIAGATLSKK